MSDYAPLSLPDDGKLAANIAHFARALRKAGLPIGPGRVVDAIRAVEAAGFTGRTDFYWTLHACFVSRPEHRAVFAQVFRLFWRDPRYLEHMMSLLLPVAARGAGRATPRSPPKSGPPRHCWTGWSAPRRAMRPKARASSRSTPAIPCHPRNASRRWTSNR